MKENKGWFSKTWTKDQEDKLRELWRQPLTATEIGSIIGKTRCAVLGKITRMGLHNRCPNNSNKTPRRRGYFVD